MNGNELHLVVHGKEDLPEVCIYVHDELKGVLATVVCSDERRISGDFVLRYAFGIGGGEDLFLIVEARIRQE